MIVKVQNEQGGFDFYQNQYLIEVDQQAGVVQRKIIVPDPAAQWSITELATDQFSIIYAFSDLTRNIVVRAEQNKPSVRFFTQLAGHNLVRSSCQPDRPYQANQYSLMYTPAFEGDMQFSGSTVSTLVIEFADGYFSRFLDEGVEQFDRLAEKMDQQQPYAITPNHSFATPAMKVIVYDILNCPFVGMVKRLFLEAKLLELIALQMDQLETTHLTGSFKSDDVDKLMAVKEWLNEHFLQPVTLLDVARSAGLNDFKLKKGFRELFNTTVFSYLTDLRMTYARRQLLTGKQTVSEVADALSYKHVQHFTYAFRRYFGYLPGGLRG